MAENSSALNRAKMRVIRSFSTGVLVLVGTLVFMFIAMLCVAVTHMDRNDPRALMLEKVIGYGGLFLGMIFVVIRQELAKFLLQRTENKLAENTQATVETKQNIERVVSQTNGGLDKRMRDIIAETIKDFPTKQEMLAMVTDAAQKAVERAARKRRRQRAR